MPKKRSDDQIAQHRRRVAEMTLAGQRQEDIAAALRISQQSVSRDLAAVIAESRQQALADTVKHKATELARLDAVERQLWQAWEESKGGSLRHQQQTTPNPSHEGEGHAPLKRRRTSRATRNSHGNPHYMKQILAISNRRCRLLGLYERLERSPALRQSKDPAQMTFEERTARCLELLQSATLESGTGESVDT